MSLPSSPSSSPLSPPRSASPSWVVQKYGGTSVGKFLSSIVCQVVPSYAALGRVVVVCSALSGQTKTLGTTNLLLQAAAQALAASSPVVAGESLSASHDSLPPLGGSFTPDRKPSPPNLPSVEPLFQSTVDQILVEHLAAAQSHVKEPVRLAQLEAGLQDDCARLRDMLLAARIIDEISPRTKDSIMGLGERMSCRIVAAALEEQGVRSTLVTLENVIDTPFFEQSGLLAKVNGAAKATAGSEVILDHVFYATLATRLGAILQSVPDTHVPVVTGYFGSVPGSILDQVGRGYTDLCAALCAVGVRADELQIWKEVDGVFTADPRKVPSARLIPAISPEEAAELTHYGSEVIHPFTMEQAIREAIPIRIKNVMNPRGEGTVIVPTSAEDHRVDGYVEQPDTPLPSGAATPSCFLAPLSMNRFMAGAANDREGKSSAVPRKLPTAVTIKDDVIVLNVHSNRKTISSHDFYARIFFVLNRYAVPVDLIATSKMHVSMAVAASHRHLMRVKEELAPVGTVSLIRDMALVSLIGKEMRHAIGIAGKMFTTLAEGNINIELISQGASEISISVAIYDKSAVKALNLIHTAVLEVPMLRTDTGHFGRSFF